MVEVVHDQPVQLGGFLQPPSVGGVLTFLAVVWHEGTHEAPAEKPAKKRGRTRTKKTFEELVADIPMVADVRLLKGRKGMVYAKRGNKRLFEYCGPVIVVTDPKLAEGLDYEVRNYGLRVAPTEENMRKIFENAAK